MLTEAERGFPDGGTHLSYKSPNNEHSLRQRYPGSGNSAGSTSERRKETSAIPSV